MIIFHKPEDAAHAQAASHKLYKVDAPTPKAQPRKASSSAPQTEPVEGAAKAKR